MHIREKIHTALKNVLDYELKAITNLKSLSYDNKDNEVIYTEIKKKMAEELKEAELLIRRAVFAEYIRMRKSPQSTGRNKSINIAVRD